MPPRPLETERPRLRFGANRSRARVARQRKRPTLLGLRRSPPIGRSRGTVLILVSSLVRRDRWRSDGAVERAADVVAGAFGAGKVRGCR